MKESLKLSDKGSYYKQDDECLLLGIFGIFFSFTWWFYFQLFYYLSKFSKLFPSDQSTVKPVYSGHLGENDKMTTIYRWPLYRGFEFSTRYCTFVVNKHFLITCYVCLLFCSCGHVTELTLVYIYCWWIYLKVILK